MEKTIIGKSLNRDDVYDKKNLKGKKIYNYKSTKSQLVCLI